MVESTLQLPVTTRRQTSTEDRTRMHTGYHRRRAWETRLMLMLASVPALAVAAWLTVAAGTPLLAVAALVALVLADLVGAWLIWQSKP
jgi:hypothetical protein